MASRDILMTELSSAAVERIARMPAWRELPTSVAASHQAGAPLALVVDAEDDEPAWLDRADAAAGVEVIEHQVPAELLAAFFGPAAARAARFPQLGR